MFEALSVTQWVVKRGQWPIWSRAICLRTGLFYQRERILEKLIRIAVRRRTSLIVDLAIARGPPLELAPGAVKDVHVLQARAPLAVPG